MQIISCNLVIINTNCTKFLGLNIDSTLSWKDHITELSPRADCRFFMLFRIVSFNLYVFRP
jgi:hypothetical protein